MPNSRFRWRPAASILLLAAIAAVVILKIDVWPYEQTRSLALLATGAITGLLLAIWWFFFSGVSLGLKAVSFVLLLLPLGLFRYRGMSGDFVPILEFRFSKKLSAPIAGKAPAPDAERPAYPQLFGPNRDAKLPAIPLDPDWKANPPTLVWRIPVGSAWSGFVVSGNRALTQEQEGDEECVTCYDLASGKQLWKTKNPGRYETAIAGVGPRATPTISGNRVFALGAMGRFQCLDLETGKVIWSRDMAADADGARLPEWGFSSSPLVHEGKVIVSAGGSKSLLAYRVEDGSIAWTGGTCNANYSSPFLYTIAGKPQIIMFNKEAITAHDPATGTVLWERPWGKGMPHVSRPIPVGDRRMFFSSGYGVGSALLELKDTPGGKLEPDEVWKTVRYQSKFATPVERDGYVYGISDGIFACIDLRDGTVKWKGGRYGHGQALMVGDYILQMTEQPGDLVLLKPTPEAPNELGRIPVFETKTWNPIALTGDLLIARTDQEAVCLKLPVQGKP